MPRVEAALETTFSVDGLKALIREGTQLAATESAGGAGAEIQRAHDELHQLPSPHILVPIAILTGIGLGRVIVLATGGRCSHHRHGGSVVCAALPSRHGRGRHGAAEHEWVGAAESQDVREPHL